MQHIPGKCCVLQGSHSFIAWPCEYCVHSLSCCISSLHMLQQKSLTANSLTLCWMGYWPIIGKCTVCVPTHLLPRQTLGWTKRPWGFFKVNVRESPGKRLNLKAVHTHHRIEHALKPLGCQVAQFSLERKTNRKVRHCQYLLQLDPSFMVIRQCSSKWRSQLTGFYVC